jgi:hypothetical protein
MWLRIGTSEPSGSIKCREVLDWLRFMEFTYPGIFVNPVLRRVLTTETFADDGLG